MQLLSDTLRELTKATSSASTSRSSSIGSRSPSSNSAGSANIPDTDASQDESRVARSATAEQIEAENLRLVMEELERYIDDGVLEGEGLTDFDLCRYWQVRTVVDCLEFVKLILLYIRKTAGGIQRSIALLSMCGKPR